MPTKNIKNLLKALTGGEAVAEALRQINPTVFAVYPITPQTPIIEKFAQMVAEKEVETEFVNVESEHSALSVVVGASAAGGRAMTATSSQGLALMAEILSVASGLRLPIVMNLVTRSISAPINIHNDHQDAMMVRDLGWLQIFCENNQEVYENNFLAVRLAESKDVLLPIMVCQDGFITSHNIEGVKIYPDKIIKNFIKEYKVEHSIFDFKNPITIGPLALPDSYFEIRTQIATALNKSEGEYLKIGRELEKITGHKYDYFEEYHLRGADAVLVAMGSVAGTIKFVVNKMRQQGKKVGLLKVKLFRPFVYQKAKSALKGAKFVGVIDRAPGFGSHPPLFGEINQCLSSNQKAQSYVAGLGGRNIYPEDIEKVFKDLLANKTSEGVKYIS